ncbi:hypothetical protein BJF93_16665 [Xaviernesmea oryzae]|uniref:YhaN AAA domain-containing protein n=1 Tax=Xaviernesmea oryzae TaxID=464029 RepID=A0A1Q9ASU3_9HYPH|nr:AAA family ATPase [Xaviernesmea oryzae]OLP58497.1 hypothetical protein BJF93_16665 [Xaviernesmea oryzae]SEK59297.1 Uncharacterized protein YhaN [Xaviernesmea oryzae]
MRLNRLDLVRYGKFTDRRLDFGTRRQGADLHIVYGPNEAGKSTLFNGFLDLLFGIEARSAYGFLHPYPAMRVGGIIETGVGTQEVFRVKRAQNTLIDAADRPLPDGLFAAALAGIDRDSYRMMFSLDDDTIEKGGDAILKSEGELGTLLFAASAGLPDTAAALEALKNEADSFYKPQGRKHQLGELKDRLDRLRQEKTALDVTARAFKDLRRDRDVATEAHERAVAARASLQAALEHCRAAIDAMPILARLKAGREELEAYAELPEPPSHWFSELPGLLREEVALATRLAESEAARARIEAAMEGLVRDPDALSLAAGLAALTQDNLDARERAAAQDLPVRVSERQRVLADLSIVRARLGLAEDVAVTRLIVPAAELARLQALARRHAQLAERVAASGRELTAAEKAVRQAVQSGKDETEAASVDDELVERLKQALAAARASDAPLRRQEAERRTQTEGAQLAERLAALSPFAGSPEDLAALGVPAAEEVASWRLRTASLEEERLRVEARLGDIDADLAADTARADALASRGGLVEDEAAARLRAAREAAWQAHEDALDRQTATRFRAALTEDDEAVAARLAHAAELSRLRDLTEAKRDKQARRQALQDRLATLRQEQARIDDEVVSACSACGLDKPLPPARLDAWLIRRVEALAARTALIDARRAGTQAAREEDGLRAALSEALLPLLLRADSLGGQGSPLVQDALPSRFDALLAFAERRLAAAQDKARDERAAREAAESARALLESRREDHEAASAEQARWETDWQRALAQAAVLDWIMPAGAEPGDAAVPPPDLVLPLLGVLQEAETLAVKLADLDHRIAAMEADRAAFRAAVARLQPMGQGDDPLSVLDALRRRLQVAQEAERLGERLEEEARRQEEAEARLLEDQNRHDALKREMLRLFDAESLSEVATRLDAVKTRHHLRQRLSEAEGDLCRRLQVDRPEDAEAQLEALDRTALAEERAALEVRLADAESETGEALVARRAAEKALAAVAGSDAAAHLEEQRRTVLADIEARALRYLRLRAGILAGEEALRLYRERHRSAMLARASQAFSAISGGDYEGLGSERAKGKEVLFARAAGGATKFAEDLSKGTRFQLYLALRIAGYHETAELRDPLPFIADDIMETFDDRRAGHAFRLMGDMALKGQVIYLTHHEHLCEIARSVCPDVQLHRL